MQVEIPTNKTKITLGELTIEMEALNFHDHVTVHLYLDKDVQLHVGHCSQETLVPHEQHLIVIKPKG